MFCDMQAANPVEQFRVALVIERQVGYREYVLRGIWKYATRAGNWLCQGTDLRMEAIPLIAEWKPQGIIAGMWDMAVAEELVKLDIPLVDVFDWASHLAVKRVGLDDREVGRMAAEYLCNREFSNFAMVGWLGVPFAKARQAGFVKSLAEAGHVCLMAPPNCVDGGTWSLYYQRHVRQQLRDWIKSLPLPTAVFAVNDDAGVRVIETCRELDIHVPEQICVLGVDNDSFLCQLTHPPLSSIEIGPERIGYQAAALLDQMMHHQPVSDQPVLLPPVQVIERQSTDVMAVEDAEIASALQFIRTNAHRQIKVADVLNHVAMPRRTLERRFQAQLGRGPLQEILRMRFDRAKHLLIETDLSIPMVARRSGFGGAERFCSMFRKHMGKTPSEFRRSVQ